MDLTTKDYEGYLVSLVTGLKSKIPEYTDFSDNDPGMVLFQLLAKELDTLSYYNDVVEQNLHLDTARIYTAKVSIANAFGYKIHGATPSIHQQVAEIVPNTTEDTIIFKKGDIISTKEINQEDKILFEVMEDLIIPPNKTGLEQDKEGNYLYTTKVIHGYPKKDIIIGSSQGTKYQSFKINDINVIKDSIELKVLNEEGFEKWSYVDNFLFSHGNDKVYTITFDGIYYYIKFGSGVNGLIPPLLRNNIVVSYRIGGGQIGNVGYNKIIEPENSPSKLKKTFNTKILELGIDREDLDNLVDIIPAFNRTMERAVHLKDYEDILLEKMPIVSKVKAIANKDRTLNAIDVYILLKSGKDISEEDMKKLNTFYDSVKMTNTQVTVNKAEFIKKNLNVIVWLPDNVAKTEITPKINEYLESYFTLGNKEFGEELNTSKMIVDLMNIPNVKAVNVEEVNKEQPKPYQILEKGEIKLDIRGGY